MKVRQELQTGLRESLNSSYTALSHLCFSPKKLNQKLSDSRTQNLQVIILEEEEICRNLERGT
jgi:hypothetical protein